MKCHKGVPHLYLQLNLMSSWRYSVNIIVFFNKMQNLKFKMPPMVAVSAAVNQCSGSLKKSINRVQRGQRVTFFATIGGLQSIL